MIKMRFPYCQTLKKKERKKETKRNERKGSKKVKPRVKDSQIVLTKVESINLKRRILHVP